MNTGSGASTAGANSRIASRPTTYTGAHRNTDAEACSAPERSVPGRRAHTAPPVIPAASPNAVAPTTSEMSAGSASASNVRTGRNGRWNETPKSACRKTRSR